MNLSQFIENAPASIKNSFIYRKHVKGSSILFPGESNQYLYILSKGTANVIMQSTSGTELTLYSYEAYSCFGELELFNKNAKTCDIVCAVNCNTIVIHKNKVFEWMQLDFEFTKFLIEQLTDKILVNSHKLITLSLLNVTDRFLYCIYVHYKLGDLDTLTKETVCSETFIPLRSLNRAITQCKLENLIDFQAKHFQIISLEKFKKHCEDII